MRRPPNRAHVVPDPPGVEQAATGHYRLSDWNGGTLTPLCPARGRENASVRERGRRRRSSPTSSCNGTDKVKVRQERETCEREPTSVARVSRRHNGSPLVTTARVPARARCAGRPEPGNRSGKRSAVKVARSVWDGGTAVKPYLSLPIGRKIRGRLRCRQLLPQRGLRCSICLTLL